MTTQSYIMEYEFVSSKAYGKPFKRQVTINAHNEQGAYKVAKIIGFQEFGAMFNDNCIDWHIVQKTQN